MQHVALNAPEALLALFVEDLLHGLVHAALNIPVEIVESESRVLGQCLSHGRLSGSHIANDDDTLHKFSVMAQL